MTTKPIEKDIVKTAVRERYGSIASQGGCCGPSSCCGGASNGETLGQDPEGASRLLGYSGDDLACVPSGANLGLGCGNPQVIASLQPGETVVDLGSDAGFDSFLAAQAVGEHGHAIGVDMTPETVSKARCNQERAACLKSSSVSAKSNRLQWPTPVWMSSFATASSTYLPTSPASLEKRFACSSRAGSPGHLRCRRPGPNPRGIARGLERFHWLHRRCIGRAESENPAH